ncbi:MULTISPECIES: hypothetical protein [unclassified Paraflavitalea]|uniref:hypothetical protein n=1 Tax=unclassified Paraflavitalea TaxID=2798305 RepID=UPI003D3442F6
MKVIALNGPENSGKSHTINIAYTLLLEMGYIQVTNKFENLGNPKYEDFTDILTKDNIKLGIVAMGDYINGNSSLKNLLLNLEKEKCNIAICACRNNPKIISAVEKYTDHKIENKTSTSDETLFRIVNFNDAKRLLSHLNL